jgi:hypothetical protein
MWVGFDMLTLNANIESERKKLSSNKLEKEGMRYLGNWEDWEKGILTY